MLLLELLENASTGGLHGVNPFAIGPGLITRVSRLHLWYDIDLCKSFGAIISRRLFWSANRVVHILVVSHACRVPFGVPRALLTSEFPPRIFRRVQSVPDASHVPIAVSVCVWAEGRVANGCQAPCCSHKSTLQEM